MLQTFSSSSFDPATAAECLSQLRIQICSVRLPASTKLVDIVVIMKIDNKYTYRTELIRKKGRTSPLIIINESFDALVSTDSKINFKILAPTRLFGSHDLGQLEFNLKSIINDYYLNEQLHNSDPSPSYRVQLAFENSANVSNPFRINPADQSSLGMIEVIFNGSILKQSENRAPLATSEQTNDSSSNSSPIEQEENILATVTNESMNRRTRLRPLTQMITTVTSTNSAETTRPTMDENQLAQLREQLPPGWELRLDNIGRPYYVDHTRRRTTWLLDHTLLPPGWEERVDDRGRVYYVNHQTRITTWTPPTASHLSNLAQWQNQYARSHSLFNQFEHRFLPQTDTNDPNEDPLPEGWQRMFDNQGRSYYVNHSSKTTQWEDPRRMDSHAFDTPLPNGYEMRYTKEGQAYFYNRRTKTLTFQDPRIGSAVQTINGNGASPIYQRSFPHKIRQFRYLCSTNSGNGQLKVTVRRDRLFDDSFHYMMDCQSCELRRRLYISFKNEEALDYGGVAREWFFRLSHEVLNPMYCLFEYANKKNYYLQINPASSINPDHLLYFRFVGRFVAMALYHEKFIDNGFSLPFYKRLLGKTLTMHDLESLDPEFYNSLSWIREHNLDENDDLELYFNTSYELFGKIENIELKPGGNEIKLTEENKNEYLELITQWRFSRGVEEQTKAFLQGFNEVVPLQWIQIFDEREVELLLCGISKIDVIDWQRNTIYKHYSENNKQIQWFWQFVQEINDEQRARLLQFVTGTCRVPIGGFAELLGSNGPQKFCIEKYGKDNILPRSHTCFNRIDLPPYKKYEILKEKLLYAIEECEGFGQE